MDILYFTFTAIILYLGSDWVLRRVEAAIGRQLEHRNLIFFAILLLMALASFALIRQYAGQ